jgi:hypothetical protein
VAKDLEALFRYEVLKMLKMLKVEGKINAAVIENMLSWHHSGFNVYCDPTIWPSNDRGLEDLARYIIRACFSQQRMSYIPATDSLDGQAKVIYRSKDERTSKTFEALDWLARLVTHIPNKGEQMVRYYGYYSNKSRGLLRKPVLNPSFSRPGSWTAWAKASGGRRAMRWWPMSLRSICFAAISGYGRCIYRPLAGHGLDAGRCGFNRLHHRHRSVCFHLTSELAHVQVMIYTLPGQKLFVGALFHDAALLDHHHPVRIRNGRQTVGNDKADTPFHQLPQTFLDADLGAGIDRAGRFGQDEDGRIGQDGPRDGHELPLSAGQARSPFGYDGVVPLQGNPSACASRAAA